jgi:hypothetical protein
MCMCHAAGGHVQQVLAPRTRKPLPERGSTSPSAAPAASPGSLALRLRPWSPAVQALSRQQHKRRALREGLQGLQAFLPVLGSASFHHLVLQQLVGVLLQVVRQRVGKGLADGAQR